MSDYLKSTNFATKDALPSGNAGKIVKGTEIDNEFNAIADAVESKADLLNPIFSGLLTTDTLATGGAANIGGTLAVASTLSAAEDVQFTGTGRMLVPKGTTAQRPATPAAGSVRYNTTLNYLENYNGTAWKAVGDVVPADVSDEVNTATGYFQVPVGISAQRPVTPLEGIIRYNSEFDIYEGYINSTWHRFQTYPQGAYTINFLIVAGGGGGGPGGAAGGGGGGGGFIASSLAVTPGATYTVVIGGGGAANTPGTNSSITGVAIANGGGNGGAATANGSTGGSGGGGGSGAGDPTLKGFGGAGTSGQGFAGGNGDTFVGGGGGGGSAVGGNAAGAGAGNGGAGFANTLTGTTVYYSGGGGGGAGGSDADGAGGIGGGGGGGFNGATNTGGGGGGFNNGVGVGTGGSGVGIFSIPTANYSGVTTGAPTVTISGANTILKYTVSGTYTA